MPDFIDSDMDSKEYKTMQKHIEARLKKSPEYIIALLDNRPETKKRVFDRLNKFGPVKFYKYLDKDAAIIKYIEKEVNSQVEV